ncbi:hypothetical protein JW948_16440 [bacterium]|nr:hypothetical protein [bacterium]
MNKTLLKQHIKDYSQKMKEAKEDFIEGIREREELVDYYQQMSKKKILAFNEDDIYDYISNLWAMLIWGNKHYYIDKIIEDNGLNHFRKQLAELVWGDVEIATRWDNFRKNVKGMGPAMISEILCKTYPDKCMLWNRRAYVALNYLEVEKLPRYDYQLTGKVYQRLCEIIQEIAAEMKSAGLNDTSFLAVDYFIWDELQVEDNLSKIYGKKEETVEEVEKEQPEAMQFIHNDIRDKVRDIGQWLGFTSKIEQKVSDGSKVDAIWEATIGNMGRVIYVFEVQTKGSIDSLILNLLKSLNNSAVQGVVAVSDKNQIEQIKKHVQDVRDLKDKLKCWDYQEVLKVHESLEFVNSSINNLGLVPQGF